METAEFLTRERDVIVREAEETLMHLRERHYESAGAVEVERRLSALFDHLVAAVTTRDLGPVVGYAQEIADERFAAGYDLAAVQTGFNALEAATWGRILTGLEPTQLAEALGLVSTVFGAAKDALGRRYVSLATKTRAPSLDLRALFAGTDGA